MPQQRQVLSQNKSTWWIVHWILFLIVTCRTKMGCHCWTQKEMTKARQYNANSSALASGTDLVWYNLNHVVHVNMNNSVHVPIWTETVPLIQVVWIVVLSTQVNVCQIEIGLDGCGLQVLIKESQASSRTFTSWFLLSTSCRFHHYVCTSTARNGQSPVCVHVVVPFHLKPHK